jgi:tRNA(Ile)-lysidine synthetase-like protein
MLERVESFIREQALIEPAGEVTVLVSGGADSTCLWHVLRGLGYAVSALHVAHGLRGAESDEDARFCRDQFGAEIVACVSETQSPSEAEMRGLRYSLATDRLRATGHTASDQLESVLLGLVASGSPQRIKARREDGIVRPLLGVWREETRAYCDERGLPYREDTSNPSTKRGLIRNEILPLLEQLDPRARSSLLSLADERPRLPRSLERTLAELLARRDGTAAADLGAGVRAVREYGTLRLEGSVKWGPWTIASEWTGLEVRARRPGDRLAGRRKKVQDLFVDAKVPRAERDAWPLVVSGDDVVAVPGLAEAPGWEGAVTWRR